MNKWKSDYQYLMWALFGAAVLGLLVGFVLSRFDGIVSAVGTFMGVLTPFIIGGVIAYILKPICAFFEEKLSGKLKRGVGGLSIVLTLLIALAVIVVLLILVVPTLIESIYSVIRLIPSGIESLETWLLGIVGDNETMENYITGFSDEITTMASLWLSTDVLPNLESIAGQVTSSVTSIVNMVYNFFIGIIVAIYVLGSRKTFARQGKKLVYAIFGQKWSDIIIDEFRYADRVFSGFISGRLVDALIIGVICFIGTLIIGTPYKILISVIVGVTNIIPFFGPYIGMFIATPLILMVDPVKAIIFLVFDFVLQQIDGNVIGPRILGNVTGLSGFWVLFAILVFGGLFGFIGMFVGVPVFSVIYDVVRKLVNWGTEQHRLKEGATE